MNFKSLCAGLLGIGKTIVGAVEDPSKRVALERDADMLFKLGAAMLPAGMLKDAFQAAADVTDKAIALDPAHQA